MVRDIKVFMEKFETHKAARSIEKFLIDDFSNWYLRRSRRRLWVEEETVEKLSGYSTMYEIFLNLVKIIAPFTPFISEEIYQNLKTDDMPESVHLCDYITPDEKLIDDELEKGMERIRDLVEVGRALRAKIGVKVRYPLGEATLVCTKEVEDSIRDLLDLLVEEINVKKILFDRNKDKFVIKQVKPKYSILGPKLKDKMKQFSKVLEEMDKTSLYQQLMEEKENAKVAAKLDRIKAEMDQSAIIKICEDTKFLKQFQETKENLDCLPTLDIKDIEPSIKCIKETKGPDKVSAACYEQSTSGILYFVSVFGVGTLPKRLIPLVSFFSHVLPRIGTRDHDYTHMAQLIDTYTGGIGLIAHARTRFDNAGGCVPLVTLNGKCLVRNQNKMFAIIEKILCQFDFSNIVRLKSLLLEYRAALESMIVQNGHRLAISLASRNFSPTCTLTAAVCSALAGRSRERVVPGLKGFG